MNFIQFLRRLYIRSEVGKEEKMSKFKKVAKFVAITKKVKESSKKERFEALKNTIKQAKSSNEGNGGLNDKYAQEAALEEKMQEMYNAR